MARQTFGARARVPVDPVHARPAIFAPMKIPRDVQNFTYR
jgi:hypothetical protein